MHPKAVSRGLAIGAVVSVLISLQVEAKDKTFYNNGEFEKLLHRAGDATKSNSPQTKDGFVPIFAGAQGTSGNQWQVNLTGAWQVSQYSVQTQTNPALVTNHGSKFEFVFLGQPIPGIVATETYNQKGTQKAIKAWKSKFADVPVVVGLEDNRIFLTAEYSYTEGVNGGDIRKRLKYLFEAGGAA